MNFFLSELFTVAAWTLLSVPVMVLGFLLWKSKMRWIAEGGAVLICAVVGACFVCLLLQLALMNEELFYWLFATIVATPFLTCAIGRETLRIMFALALVALGLIAWELGLPELATAESYLAYVSWLLSVETATLLLILTVANTEWIKGENLIAKGFKGIIQAIK